MGMQSDLRRCCKRCCCRPTACRGGRQRGRQRQRKQPQLLIVVLAVVVYLPIHLLTTEALRSDQSGDRHDGKSMKSENPVPVGWHVDYHMFLKDNTSSERMTPVYWDTILHQLLIYFDYEKGHFTESMQSEKLVRAYWSPIRRCFMENVLPDKRNVREHHLVTGYVVRVYWNPEVHGYDENDLAKRRLWRADYNPVSQKLELNVATPKKNTGRVWDAERKEFVDYALEVRRSVLVYWNPVSGRYDEDHSMGGRPVPVVWDAERKEFVAENIEPTDSATGGVSEVEGRRKDWLDDLSDLLRKTHLRRKKEDN